MTDGYRVLASGATPTPAAAKRAFAVDVLIGLSSNPKRLSSRWLYDAHGSAAFEAICDLDEYYLTRSEFEIFRGHRAEMLDRFVGQPLDVVDLGAGDGRKTSVLLSHLTERGADVRYVPIDISESAMKGLVGTMRGRFPQVPIDGLVSEYFDGVRWLAEQDKRTRLVLFLGSNIGNFDRAHARAFLLELRSALSPDDYVLVGFDLKKDIELLLAAYNDREGVTADFNLNLLDRINAELGGDFDRSTFRHFATYNVFSGAMESYLVSLVRQSVRIDAVRQSFEFRPWEPIHTEYSYKFLDEDISGLAESAGFAVEGLFYDEKRWFCDALWRVKGEG